MSAVLPLACCSRGSLARARRLSLLNITVSQLAKSVNTVLSMAYRDIYSDGTSDDVGQLQLLTSPVNSTEEVLQLYNGGLVPAEIAVPTVLNAIGATKHEIDAAMKRVLAQRDESERREKDDLKRGDASTEGLDDSLAIASSRKRFNRDDGTSKAKVAAKPADSEH